MADFHLQPPTNRELNGGDLLAQCLRHLGVEVAFGLHGGHLDAFLLGAVECGIKLIDTRHETVAVQAAEGYAKVKGKVGVCFVTANSGFSNGLPGLATAFADRSPIFCITSSPPLQDAETNALQGFHDQVVIAKPITKFAHRVTNVEEIPRLVAYAFRAAHSGIKGPVLLDVPIDVLFTPPQQHRIVWGALTVPPAYSPAPDPAAVEEVVKAWSAARRPVIITGTGVRGAGKVLTRLVAATHTPVFYSNKFSTPVEPDHELRGGPAVALAMLEEKPDFVLLLAARTGFLLGGRSGAIVPDQGCTLAQVDVDGSEIGRSNAVHIGIVSDVSLFIDAFLAKTTAASASTSNGTTSDGTTASGANFHRNDHWVQTCTSLRTTPSPFSNDPKIQADGHLHPYHAMSAIMRSLPPSSTIIIDGGEAGQWASMTAELANPHLVIVSTGYLGFLGNGWGYSLGAVTAEPSRLVVNIHGDGSAGFHIQELDTYARFGLNIMTVVFNNNCWGMSVNGQDLLYQNITPHRPAVQLSKSCRYDIVAQGFGCEGAYVDKHEQIAPKVEEFWKLSGPSLMNLIVSRTPTTPATLSMVGATKDPDVIVVPYYDNVPRPYYKEAAGQRMEKGGDGEVDCV